MKEEKKSEHCYGCSDRNRRADGSPGSGRVNEAVFVDSRTGRGFCAQDVIALAEWEMDGCPDSADPEFPYPYASWIAQRGGSS